MYREKRMIETLTVIKLVLEIVVAILQLIVLFA
ncbi:small toxic protein shoB [Salmonella enterica]|uniref:Small toxic protein shoB n=1 Tax=Salmonella enterica subsp. houtenae serovar 45:g,z51:- TaxID=1967611 RepID=A0A736R7B9_SALHO|nr:small toxic protein shoB [Salmonella enterica subsp. enterica serovar Pensacola]EAN5040491.1 small toxic protein shoB [Salmonella enterica]ECG1391930.1 small toxic protein shoB [Salmonella enterica subsp. houtenae str. CFSAN000557]ECG8627982.1 small toxic protein shoB [Salmonella enterica subsp. diarizonae]EDK3863350.1 small toxic protein shoB [Salmonella enterica subsp. enterica serovar Muenchen]EDU1499807.1 small toxic protein shoB [Salmonella enterica subsp. enterica serovar Gaminara]ED